MARLKRKVAAGLAAATMAATGLAVTSAPAHAVGCYGVECDNQGPKGNGCFPDAVTRASDAGLVRLRYSKACHAFWAYGPWDPDMWATEIHLEMQRWDGSKWVHAKRLQVTHSVGEGPDWTNALGARTKNVRFRAIYHDPWAPSADAYTIWVRGGTQS